VLYGNTVIDFVTPSGFLGDLSSTPRESQTMIERIDLTQGLATLRYRPSAAIDFSWSATHAHAILPNKWWQDWTSAERARLGFTVDGNAPLGSRRTSARMITNVHVTSELTPYVVVRYDRRHEDHADGYETQAGIKYADFSFGYVDVSGAYRRHFEATNQLASMQVGLDLAEGVNLDAGVTALRTTPDSGEAAMMLYDLNAAASLELSAIDPSLQGIRLLGMVQTFVDPEMLFHVLYLRVGYRFRG
jgi:hypothetical protein